MSPPVGPRLLSLAAANCLDAGPIGTVRAARAGGFDAVGLRLEVEHLADAYLRELKRTLADEGVRLHDVEVVRLRGSDISAFRPLVDAAARLGSTYLIAISYDVDRPRTLDAFGRLCDAAAAVGVQVAVEFLPLTAVDSVASAAALLAAADRPNACMVVDPLHLSRTGGTVADVAAHAQHVGYLQLCDAPAAVPADADRVHFEARHDRLPPGAGGLPIAELLAALPGRPVSVEVQSDAMARELEPAARAALLMRALESFGLRGPVDPAPPPQSAVARR